MAESVSLSKCRLESIIANMCSKHFFLLHTKMFTFLVWNTTMGNKKGGFCWGFWQAINYTKVVNCWFSTPIRLMHTVQVSEVHKQVLNYEHIKVIPWYLTSLFQKKDYLEWFSCLPIYGIKIQQIDEKKIFLITIVIVMFDANYNNSVPLVRKESKTGG